MNQIDRVLVAERARLGIFCGRHHQVLNMVGGELERQLAAVREGEGEKREDKKREEKRSEYQIREEKRREGRRGEEKGREGREIGEREGSREITQILPLFPQVPTAS